MAGHAWVRYGMAWQGMVTLTDGILCDSQENEADFILPRVSRREWWKREV